MLLDKEVEKKVDEFENKEKKPYEYSKRNEKVVEKPVDQVEDVKEEDDKLGASSVEDDIKDGVVVECENLNIRKEGKTNATILIVVPVGTEVAIDMKDNTVDFYNVILKDGTEGFAMKKYIKLV